MAHGRRFVADDAREPPPAWRGMGPQACLRHAPSSRCRCPVFCSECQHLVIARKLSPGEPLRVAGCGLATALIAFLQCSQITAHLQSSRTGCDAVVPWGIYVRIMCPCRCRSIWQGRVSVPGGRVRAMEPRHMDHVGVWGVGV
jgi:hypothetical protein